MTDRDFFPYSLKFKAQLGADDTDEVSREGASAFAAQNKTKMSVLHSANDQDVNICINAKDRIVTAI